MSDHHAVFPVSGLPESPVLRLDGIDGKCIAYSCDSVLDECGYQCLTGQ